MKIVFFGTPDFVLPILDLLHKTFRDRSNESGVVAVVTQKPKPTGREQKLTYSPVDTWAYKRDIEVIHELASSPSADLGILAAYGEIIPQAVIDKFKFGILNVHPSLLPKYRGASPIQAAIASGDAQTGVSIIRIDTQMDHGPIVSQFKEDIVDTDTLETLRLKLFERSAQVLVELIAPFIQGKINLREQNHDEATYSTLVKKEHGLIPSKYIKKAILGKEAAGSWVIPFIKDYSLTPAPRSIEAFIRALTPWPGVWTQVNLAGDKKQPPRRLKILKAHLDEGRLIFDEVQLEGKNPVSWEEFQRGYPTAKLE